MTAAQYFNEHSYLIVSGTLLAFFALALLVNKAHRAWRIWIGLVLVAIVIWLALRTGSGTQLSSTEDYEALLRSGQPTLVEFYSDY